MPTFQVATTGDPNDTSYCSVAEADAYHEKKKRTATIWAALSNGDKQNRLMEATELLDRECVWEGTQAKLRPDNQALYWPRYGCYDNDGIMISSLLIPADLKKATAELAFRLNEKDLDKEPNVNVLSVSMGQGAFSASFNPNRDPRVLVRSVFNFLKPFLANGGSSALGKAVR